MRGRKSRAGRGPDALASASPEGQIFAALAVLATVALSGLALVVFAPSFWWIFTTYFWISFPAFGLLTRGLAGLSNRGGPASANGGGEREILEALREYGELTPTRAAMETSLRVAEANEVLKDLAEGGHLEVRVRGGALSYALWKLPEGYRPQEAVREPYREPRLKLLEPGGEAARQDPQRSER